MMVNGRERMESSASVSDYESEEPLADVDVLEDVSAEEVVLNVPEPTEGDVPAEEVVLTVPEPTEGVLSIDSQRMECTAVRRRRHAWAGKFPCGVCGKGVRNGLRCVTCLLWVHHGKTKPCAGLKNRRQLNVESYSCPTCIKKNHNNNKPKKNRKRSLERVAIETDEETSPVVKRTKKDGNSPKNNHLNMEEDISKTQEILDTSTNSNDISINSNTEKVSYEDVYIQQMIQNFQTTEKDLVIKFAEKYEKENLIKQTKDLEICRLIECFDAKEYRHEGGHNIKENIIKCLNPLKNRKQTLIKAIIFLNQNKEEVEGCMTKKNTEELIEVLVYNICKRMPIVCEECADIYCDKISNKPNVRCYICKLGKHECLEQNLKFVYEDTKLLYNMKGVMWMCFDCREFVKYGKLVEQIRDQIVIENIRNRESNRSVKHPEAEQRKHCESEDKTNKNRDKPTEENGIEKEKKKSEKSNEVVKDKEMNVLDFTVMKISEESLKSLEDTQWVDDQMIYISLAMKQNEVDRATDKILFVSPSITQLIRKSTDRTNIKETIKNLQINEKDWVFYPVSNNNQVDRPGGGTHWSLLVYCKAKDVYYHHDPINPTNEMHAVELIHKISSADSGFSISQTKVKPPQQKNGYDCGPYIMLFANKIADNLVKGVNPNYYEVSKDEASRYRKELKDKIQLEMKKASREPETKHYQQTRNNKLKT